MRWDWSLLGPWTSALFCVSFGLGGCSRARSPEDKGVGGALNVGGEFSSGSGGEVGGQDADTGGASAVVKEPTGPQYHPPPGFEDCIHAEVKEDCLDGWCKLPPSCFVLGAFEDEWTRGRHTGEQVEVTLTHPIEIQETEFSKGNWAALLGVDVVGVNSTDCMDPSCPQNNVTWWEAIHVANALSERRGLEPCYQPRNCTGEIGAGRVCDGVAEPGKSVYECEGYRLPTRAEVEYATKAGTTSTWYSGSITEYDNLDCNFDENLEKIGWYCFNSDGHAHQGGGKERNRFGVHDLIGNVMEWTNEENRTTAAEGGTDPSGSVNASTDRQAFGGAYHVAAWSSCQTSDVFAASWDVRGPQAGFRLYRTLFEDSVRSGPIIKE